ncbi:MAG: hypothetical protein RBS43_02660 [Candidatus Cloacimonas sp.]|jgi:hypothetical protein|nr:hypothetical protein [Candidatus Cloacimonas sp.]
MKKLLLLIVLTAGFASAFALSSTTNSAFFTLDTVAPDLQLQSPNGGEEWYLGDTNNILWTATDTNLLNDSVYLWYSLNGGTDYVVLAEGIANGSSYPWLMPETTTINGKVKIRVADSFGNLSNKVSVAPFTITYIPPATPGNVNVNISNTVDAVITWNPVTQTIYSTPITPDGYLVLYNETPYEDNDNLYYFLWDVTTGTSFTHPRVALHRDQMYYRVVAYKDYDGRMADILSEAKAHPERLLSFREIKQRMNGGAK